jgi:hypothetical protein
MSIGKTNFAVNFKNRSWLFGITLGLIMLIFGIRLSSVNAQDLSIPTTQNCNASAATNSVIWCGADSVSSLQNSYQNGDSHNSAASIQAIYSYFGINATDIKSMSASSLQVEAGSVDKAGDVFDANGNKIASGAITAGRDDPSGSTAVTINGTKFYTRPPSVSFVQNSLSAYVVMINKSFAFAILASCGNPVKATPLAYAPPVTKVVIPPTPTPTPKPIPAPPIIKPIQKPVPSPVCSGTTTNASGVNSQGGNCSTNTTTVITTVTPPATPTPSASGQCSSLALAVDPNNPLSVTATVTDQLNNGATLSGITYDFGDNTGVSSPTSEASMQHTYANAGTYMVTATLNFTGGSGTVPTSACQSSITTNAATVTPTCNQLSLNEGDNRTVTVSNFQTTANNASLISQDINWGDGSSTSGVSNIIGQSHQYAADGTYTVSGDANYSVNGQTITAGGNGCTQQVTVSSAPTVTTASTTPTPTSTVLVNTGAGDPFIVFGGASILGTLGYRFVLRRRLNRL